KMGLPSSLSPPPSVKFVFSTASSQPGTSRWLRSRSHGLKGFAPAPTKSTKAMPKAKIPAATRTAGPLSSRQRSATDPSRGAGGRLISSSDRVSKSRVMAGPCLGPFLFYPIVRQPTKLGLLLRAASITVGSGVLKDVIHRERPVQGERPFFRGA